MKTSIFQNSNENMVRISGLELFVAFLGLPVGFLFMILLTKSPESPKKLPGSPQEATKNFRGEILTIFLLPFWKINVLINLLSLTDL